MQTKRFGRTDLEITRIGVGAWAMGGAGYAFSWGPQDDDESIAAIHHALERGVNWIDTAAVYGLGHSEEVVGRALAGMRERPYVFTKCERVWDESGKVTGRLEAASIRGELEASLRRLRLDTVDLYQIHWPEPDEGVEEGWQTLCRLRDEGKVRHIGVSNFDTAQLRRANAICPVESLQPPYSLIRREIEADVLPYCAEQDIGVIAYSPMASGLLSGGFTRERAESLGDDDWRSRNPEFKEPRLSRNLELVERLREVGERHGVSPAEVAIAWTLRHPAVTAAIVGVRRPAQVDGVLGAAGLELDDADVDRIEAALSPA